MVGAKYASGPLLSSSSRVNGQ